MDKRLHRKFVLPLLASLLAGCVGHHLSRDTHQAVRMTYVHVANIYELETIEGALSPEGQSDRGFWAVFDICSLDVQGMNLKGFTYDTKDFYVVQNGQNYEASRPYRVLTVFAGEVDAKDKRVASLISRDLGLAPEQQYFPKETYPALAYRLIVPFAGWPDGYLGKPLQLRHEDPQTVLDNVSDEQPAQWQSYDRASVGPLPSTCPRRALSTVHGSSIRP